MIETRFYDNNNPECSLSYQNDMFEIDLSITKIGIQFLYKKLIFIFSYMSPQKYYIFVYLPVPYKKIEKVSKNLCQDAIPCIALMNAIKTKILMQYLLQFKN